MKNINTGNIARLIGYLGTFLFSIRLFPQIYHLFKTRLTAGLDYRFITLDLLGSSCFLIYALYLKAYPMILANSASIFCDIILLFLIYDIENIK
jgi:uncharacterized protein with PQ loop repeat